MTDPPDRQGPASWEDLIARLFGVPESRRPVYRVDIGRLMSAEARDLFVDAARRATALGERDIDTNHLLWAALQRDGLRALVKRAGADPDALLSQLDRTGPDHPDRPDEGARATVPPAGGLTLTPATKRALLQAHQISRSSGSSYIGPEHLLMALSVNPDSPAGRTLAEGQVAPDTLRAARDGGAPARRLRRAGPLGHRDPRPVRPGPHRAGPRRRARAGGRARGRDRAGHRGALPAHQEQPGAHRRGRRRQDRDRRGHRPAHRRGRRAGDAERQAGRSSSTWPAWSPAPGTGATSRSGSSGSSTRCASTATS